MARALWLGHAAFLIELGGTKLLIDPWITGNPSCPLTLDELRDVDAIDITARMVDLDAVAQVGFECYALESDAQNLSILKQYRQMRGSHFTVLAKPLSKLERLDFDIVLALDAFSRLVQTQPGYEQLIAFLAKLRCQALYFAPQPAPQGAYKNFSAEEFVNFVLEVSTLSMARLLGSTETNRSLYLLSG